MERMQRTQVYLEPDLNAALNRLARQRGTSKANLLRLAARRLLEDETSDEEEDAIMGLIGIGGSGSGHASAEHDRILAAHAIGGSGT